MYIVVYSFLGEPTLLPPLFQPVIDPPYRLLSCGQNITLSLSEVTSLSFACIIFNGAQPITTEVFKNGKSIGSRLSRTIVPFDDDDFGNYTFVASTERCGSISAVSWIHQGQFLKLLM